MDSAGERFEAIRAALADRNNILTVKDLCELAGVSRSGYYNWVRSEKNRELREAKDRAAFEQILEAYRFRGYAKGVRGIHMRLLHMGIRMNVKKIRRLMRKYKLTCPIRKPNPYRRLQRSIRMGSAAENLVNREFESHGPRAILLTDITYIPLCGRFCYLSTILDACTKQVLAYAMSESLEVDFVLETVQLLIKHHGISLSKETVIHSDQGTHYTSLKFIQLVENSALRRSMTAGWITTTTTAASGIWRSYPLTNITTTSPQVSTPPVCCRYGSNENVLDLGSTLAPVGVSVWVRKKWYPKMTTYEKQKSSKSDDFEDFWYAVRDSNPRPSGP